MPAERATYHGNCEAIGQLPCVVVTTLALDEFDADTAPLSVDDVVLDDVLVLDAVDPVVAFDAVVAVVAFAFAFVADAARVPSATASRTAIAPVVPTTPLTARARVARRARCAACRRFGRRRGVRCSSLMASNDRRPR